LENLERGVSYILFRLDDLTKYTLWNMAINDLDSTIIDLI